MPAKKLFLMISFVLLAVLAASALAADLNWTNATGDRLWRNPFNWDPCNVPTSIDKAGIRYEVIGPIIDSSTTAVAYQVVVGDWMSLSDSIDMTGGSLTTGSWFILGYWWLNNGTFTMSAGTVSIGSNLFVGFQGTGTLNMNGGTLNIANLFGIGWCDTGQTTAMGYVYLNGGTITAEQFQMRNPPGTFGLLDITGGTLIIDGDKRSLVNDYIANGWITGYGGSGGVAVTYNSSTGKTAVTAYLDPRKARGPIPFNNAIDGTPYTDLSWTAGSGAVSHDVHFGTTNPPAFAGNQTETTFDPCRLELDTLYYWRIDEVNDSNAVITGDVWSFTTVSEFTTVGFLDDFNDGVIDSFWLSYSTMPGALITETDGKLRISVAVAPSAWSFAGLRSISIYPLQSFECSVDFRVPQGDPEAELRAYGIDSDFYWQHFYDHPYGYFICYENTDGSDCVGAGPAFGDEDTAWHRLKMIYDADSMTNSAYIDANFITSKTIDLTNFQIYLLMWANSTMSAPLTVEFDNFKLVSVIPLASFIYSPQKPIVDENITFDASASCDFDGTIVSYEWAFGDGNTASGEVVAHSYTQTGQYTVTLTVTDNDGFTDSAQQDVAVKIPLVAESPDPPSGAANVVLNKVLGWTAGYGAVSHDVYFGTDANGVGAAERLMGDLDGSGPVGYDDLFILADYWLADPFGSEPYAGVNYDNTVDFTDYAMLVQNYMGQPSPWFKGNTTDTSYDDPCSFALSTTYYWRVDEVNSQEKGKGDVWSFTTTAVDSNYTLVGKVMCGYQGWFNCPNDGAERGWVHWGTGDFTPNNCTVDMWPDMTEMGPGEKFLASAFDDGNDHYVFSSHNYDTVVRHFQWMYDYGIDGVYLQRFATELEPGSAAFNHRNDVLSYCKDGANMYGRVYAVMYDLSGLGQGGTSIVINDWKYLVDTMKVGRDPNDYGYMFHNGKPVVAVWGIGFDDGRQYTLQECLDLVNFLKSDLVYGGCTVMVGVPSRWRTLSGDCINDPMVHTIILAADIVSPWSVGRYDDSDSVIAYANSVWIPDVIWCQSHNIDYLPVIFPGFSWYNMKGGQFNQIPRNGGQFLWDQVKATIDAGTTMIYQAMFDEVDEGTAIFKVTNDPPVVPPAQFVTYEIDGYPLPSDEYLWLVGQAGRALRGEIPADPNRPAR